MFRTRKKKEASLVEELKELELLEEGEMVDMPDLEFEDLIEENTMSVIVRCLNPYVHKVGGLVKALPPIWGLEDKVKGRGVGDDKVQFIFEAESDLQHVLTKGPWFVNGWIVSMNRWSPHPDEEFLKRIPFWIRIRGLPIHRMKHQMVEYLMKPLGKVERIELHAKNSNSLEYVRALVWISTEEPIQFRRTARFKSGETVPTELEYEKLIKVCYTCKRLTHDQTRCNLQIQDHRSEEGIKQSKAPVEPMRRHRGIKETPRKANPKRGALKGVVFKEVTPRGEARGEAGGKRMAQSSRQDSRGELRKGKKVAEVPQLVWQQKGSRGVSGYSRSSQESTALSKGSGDQTGSRGTLGSSGEGGTSKTGQGSDSVFNRLSGMELGEDTEVTLEDLRDKLTEARSGEKQEGQSSKGSRSPPSVFERLGGQLDLTPREKRVTGGMGSSKRRRMSSSDERKSKKMRIGSTEKTNEAPSVFCRLGSMSKGSEKKSEALSQAASQGGFTTPTHSALVAASVPDHSVRRIALASGNKRKEGLKGLGNVPTVRHLQEILGQYSPEIIFLSETKSRRSYMEYVVEKLGFQYLRSVDAKGKGGGLALLWKQSCEVEILQANSRVIDAKVKWQDHQFHLTCVYGDPVKSKRSEVWERLSRLGAERQGPWILTGDFNEMVDQSEKSGGAERSEKEGLEFRQLLSNWGLWDIKHKGDFLSWAGRRINGLVQCRLDRSVANQQWLECFPQATIYYLKRVCSDHSPILTSLDGMQWKKRATFKYDHRWTKREGFIEVVNQGWKAQGNGQANIMGRISTCRKAISVWKRSAKPSSAMRIQELHYKIDEASRQEQFKREELESMRKELNEEYYNEELFWWQKSRMNWLRAGDRNTKYFHAVTKNRRAQNMIKSLIDDIGNEWFADEDLGKVAEQYFNFLFSSEDVGAELAVWSELPPVLTATQNETLMKPISREEVRRAVFEINPHKCPGPDGMNGFFFQQFWETCQEEVMEMVQRFFQTGVMEEGVNNTNICLIPKSPTARKMSEYRPISLCNVAYKVISKLMTGRLKQVMPSLISETQAAFVEGRLISDNILVAHELLHALSSDNKCAYESIAIKTDISKAYDRVEWRFLERTMQALGFNEHWIKLIMSCVSSVRYQVLINGTPFGDIVPSRGLRQGDPLSPYLFVMCTEMLVQMLKRAEESRLISGLRVARRAPPVSHLLFADDSMLYCKSSDEEIDRVTQLLRNYSIASGQRINYQKSSIYFGKHIPLQRREEIMIKLGIDQTGGEGFYLGVPESMGGSRVSILSYLKENMAQKVQGWQTKFLSPGGKEVLLKAVAMALPTYTMSCFLIPKTICKQIVSLMADFWWKTNKESKGMHWKSWDHLCKSKDCGGLGFKDLEAYNLALLGKQLWRMVTNPDSLMAKIYKSRYFKTSDPLNATLGSRPSYAWRSIFAAQELIKRGARVIIGNGQRTKVWQDRWIGKTPATMVQSMAWNGYSREMVVTEQLKVSDLLDSSCRTWNEELLQSLFTAEVQAQIRKITPAGRRSEDSYAWDFTKTGHYTVKSGYWVLVNIIEAEKEQKEALQPSLDGLYQQAWRVNASPKIRHFLWRCISNSIPVAANMVRRHIAKDMSCSRCECREEDINHVLFQCTYARLIWAHSTIHPPPHGIWSDSIYTNLHWVLNQKQEFPKEEVEDESVPYLLWRIWKNRNEFVFQEVRNKEVKKPTEEGHDRKWRAPPPMKIKCNIDGSWKKETCEGGVGWVARDQQGNLLWAGAKKLSNAGSVLETEAEALRWAIQTLTGFGYTSVVFETDSLTLKKLIYGEEEMWLSIKPIMQEISFLLTENSGYGVEFYPRSGNKVADRIARETTTLASFVPKLYSVVPVWLSSFVEVDKIL
ncbi:uncharacterized protein LOC130508476 [Raphanus sativus]|uniref:Uncharacterized protein LOC130508476 n=1 Tax=Raphanus sativus TaxID=3726 RepID=A0A9W3D8F1_RAPSA|nr:uncharacterized protein LOC130508476 [Raphanus sativus]